MFFRVWKAGGVRGWALIQHFRFRSFFTKILHPALVSSIFRIPFLLTPVLYWVAEEFVIAMHLRNLMSLWLRRRDSRTHLYIYIYIIIIRFYYCND